MITIKFKTLLTLFFLIASLLLNAEENKKYRWILDEPEKPSEEFIQLKSYIENEIYAIEAWMRDKGYPETRIDGNFLSRRATGRIKLLNFYEEALIQNKRGGRGRKMSKDDLEAKKTAVGSYGDMSATLKLNTYNFKKLFSREAKLTLAHELFHGSQATVSFADRNKDNQKWISEGTAEAVGFAWVNGTEADLWETSYNTSLFAPKDSSGKDEPYQRGHFFYYLGKDIDDSVKYLGQIIKKPIIGNGIDWLDAYLAAINFNSLAEYYPKFIQKHTDETYYPKKEYPNIALEITSKTKIKIKHKVKSIAASYDDAKVVFNGQWSGKKEKDRIFLITVDIPKADRIDDLSLIVDEKIHKGNEKDLSLVYAEAGEMEKPFIIKVTNVAKKASASKKQKFTLGMKANPISFDLPECVKVGGKGKITLKGDVSLDQFNELKTKLHVSAGAINSQLEFEAPKKAQKVKVTLKVPTISGKEKLIDLGSIIVKKEALKVSKNLLGMKMIKLTPSYRNEKGKLIYIKRSFPPIPCYMSTQCSGLVCRLGGPKGEEILRIKPQGFMSYSGTLDIGGVKIAFDEVVMYEENGEILGLLKGSTSPVFAEEGTIFVVPFNLLDMIESTMSNIYK